MIFMTISIYFIPILIGYFIIRLWQNKARFFFIEKLALGFGLGTLIITYFLFLLSFFGFRFSQLNIIMLSAGLLIISLVISYLFYPLRISLQIKNLGQIKIFQKKNAFEIIGRIFLLILILIIIFKIGYVFIEASLRPIIQFDAVANWSLRAKVFFFQEKIPFNRSEPYWLGSGGHENYPLHLSLLELWVAKVLGYWHEPTLEMISPIYFLSLLIIFYFVLVRFVRKKYTLVFTFFLATLPFLNYHAFALYADLPLSFYLTTAVLLFFLSLRTNNYFYFLLAALFCFGATWTKNEGFFLSIIILLAITLCLLIKKRQQNRFFIFPSAAKQGYLLYFILIAPWFIFKFYHHLGFSNVGSGDPTLSPDKFGFYPRVFSYLWSSLLLDNGWHILWLMFILTLISWPKKIFSQSNLFLTLTIFGFLLFYFALYVFSSANFEYIKMGMILNRNLLTIAPLVIFYLALFLGDESKSFY
jgi:hypothetical protein